MNRTFYLWGVVLLVLAGWVVLGNYVTGRTRGNAHTEVLAELPEFNLFDTEGHRFGKEDLEGRISVVSFIFTRCGGQCPTITANMKKIQTRLAQHKNLQLVSITVDPAYDTKKVLRDYAEKNGAAFASWRFLTGNPSDIKQLLEKGFLVGVEEGKTTDDIVHSEKLVLVDEQANIVAYFDGMDSKSVEALIRDLNHMLPALTKAAG